MSSIPETDELIIIRNPIKYKDGQTRVRISKVSLGDGTELAVVERVDCDSIHVENGGVILFFAQGFSTQPSGLFNMQNSPPYYAEPVLTIYMGRPFNSVNDVVGHNNGSIWFTDPPYGHEQGYSVLLAALVAYKVQIWP